MHSHVGAWEREKTWGVEQRKTYLKGLDFAFHFLAENPLSGVACDYVVEGLRKHHFKSHTIFYETLNSEILVIRVLHKSMDVELNFQKSFK